MERYIGAKLKNEINIGKLYSVHYFEYPVNFSFTGEKHNFWEFVYADKGEVVVISENEKYMLKQGEIYFHKPNEWHNIASPESVAPNVVIVSFECESLSMEYFSDKILTVGQEQKSLISKIISEYTYGFTTPLDNPYTKILVRKKEQKFGSEQLIRQYLCELLISFIRHSSSQMQRSVQNLNRDSGLFNMISNYLYDNLCNKITINDLVKYSGTNKTTINAVFNNTVNSGVIEYLISLKIDLAKKYLREANYNISQISDILGYSSIHYFSRQFKKNTGMTPSEYSLSIQAIIEKI